MPLTQQQIDDRLRASREERVGYERRLAAAAEAGDGDVAKTMKARLAEVDRQIDWLERGGPVENSYDEPVERERGEDAETRPRGRGRQTR